MTKKKAFASAPLGPFDPSEVAVFKPILTDQRLIDQSDQFLIFHYWAKLPSDEQKNAMEEDSELGQRLRTAWANYLKFKELQRKYRSPRSKPRKPLSRGG